MTSVHPSAGPAADLLRDVEHAHRHAGAALDDPAQNLLAACIEACVQCAASCAPHRDHHEHCRLCEQACNRCEAACQALLDAIKAV